MTFDHAVAILRAAGLIVQSEKGSELRAVCDPQDSEEALHAPDVTAKYRFGFSVCQIKDMWLVRASPATPAEPFPDLDSAIERGLKLLRDYRRFFSPKTYCDQYARLASTQPCGCVEDTLVARGWLEPQNNIKALGIGFGSSASFPVEFAEQRRIVVVSVDQQPNSDWLLAIRCRGRALTPLAKSIAVYEHHADGSPSDDPVAPGLSFQVATVLHSTLLAVSSNLRWAMHHDPDRGAAQLEPIRPLA